MENAELKQKVLEFMRSESIMSVAINSSDRPVSTILLFAIDDDFTVYFATHKSTQKAKALSVDNKISLSVWGHKKMLVQASGVAEEITDGDELENTLDKLAMATDVVEDFWPPILQAKGDDYVAYRIKLDMLRILDLTKQQIHVKSQFVQII